MFKDLFKSKSREILSEYQARGEETGVFSLALNNVDDPFDPDPLWDRKYGGNSGIIEEMTEDNDFRLQTAIDGCRDIKFVRDEAGRFREQTPVFTDVVMWVPEAKWRLDSRHGGVRLEAVATNLAKLHARKFGRSLPGDREPNYCVMPDDELDDGTVVFQFGFGVFIPGEDDALVGSVKVRRNKDSEPVKLPEWSFWKNGAQVKRPVGVYRSQGTLLVTPDRTGPVRAPIWFGNSTGHISVNLSAADTERVYADEDHIRVVETVVPEKEGDPFQWVLDDSTGTGDEKTLVFEVQFLAEPATERVAPPPKKKAPAPRPEERGPAAPSDGDKVEPKGPAPAAAAEPGARGGLAARVRQTDGNGERPQSSLERFFDQTDRTDGGVDPTTGRPTPISKRFSLKLAGCALLRIDGEQALPGLEEWVIWFDKFGYPLQHAEARKRDVERCLALAAVSDSRQLYYRLSDKYEFHPVKGLPAELPTEAGGALVLNDSPVPRLYHALLMLPQEASFPLSSENLILGRSDASPSAQQPDLPMELLDHPQALRWTDGSRVGGMLNALNLSRRHVRLRLIENKLEVGLSEGKTPLYVLDQERTLLKTLSPGDRGQLLMEPDEYFIVGSYLLRFHQERPQTMLSNEATVFRRNVN